MRFFRTGLVGGAPDYANFLLRQNTVDAIDINERVTFAPVQKLRWIR
jgi:hypothetical protein